MRCGVVAVAYSPVRLWGGSRNVPEVAIPIVVPAVVPTVVPPAPSVWVQPG